MSVGWQRQYETEAIIDFAQWVKIFAEEKPNDAKLQAFARKSIMEAISTATREQHDLRTGNVVHDRREDCRRCLMESGGRPCADGKGCKFRRTPERVKAIERHFGDEGKHFLDWAGAIIMRREAKACTR